MKNEKINGLTSYKRKIVLKVANLVAEEYGLSVDDLSIKSSSKRYAIPRAIAVGILREVYNIQLQTLADFFGYGHHSSVLYSVNLLKERVKTEKDVRTFIQRIIKETDKEIKPQ